MYYLSNSIQKLIFYVQTLFRYKFYSDVAIIGGYYDSPKELEVITIGKYFVTCVNQTIPNVPRKSHGLQGAQLPNGNLLVCGGAKCFHDRWRIGMDIEKHGEYHLFKLGYEHWTKVGTMKWARVYHASVFYEGSLYTTGGLDPANNVISHHEEFSINGDVREKKRLPIALQGHTATMFDQHTMLICGGSKGRKFEGVSIF